MPGHDGFVRINLAPEKKPLIDPKLLNKIPIVPIILAIALFFEYNYLFNTLSAKYQDEIAQKEEEKRRLEKKREEVLKEKEEKLAHYKEQLSALEDEIELRKRLVGQNMYHWSQVLADLTKLLPKKTVWINSFSPEDEQRITIAGFAIADPAAAKEDKKRVFIEVAKLIRTIENAYPRYRDVSVSALSKSNVEGEEAVSFQLSYSVDRTPKEENLAGEGNEEEKTGMEDEDTLPEE